MHTKQLLTSNQEQTHAPHQLGHETKHIKFQVVLLLEKIQMLRKKVKLLLEQLQVCTFAKIVFGVRCTLSFISIEFTVDPPTSKLSLIPPYFEIKTIHLVFPILNYSHFPCEFERAGFNCIMNPLIVQRILKQNMQPAENEGKTS